MSIEARFLIVGDRWLCVHWRVLKPSGVSLGEAAARCAAVSRAESGGRVENVLVHLERGRGGGSAGPGDDPG
jgi:hypothetical protein